jgi:hypothetical protein
MAARRARDSGSSGATASHIAGVTWGSAPNPQTGSRRFGSAGRVQPVAEPAPAGTSHDLGHH